MWKCFVISDSSVFLSDSYLMGVCLWWLFLISVAPVGEGDGVSVSANGGLYWHDCLSSGSLLGNLLCDWFWGFFGALS